MSQPIPKSQSNLTSYYLKVNLRAFPNPHTVLINMLTLQLHACVKHIIFLWFKNPPKCPIQEEWLSELPTENHCNHKIQCPSELMLK